MIDASRGVPPSIRLTTPSVFAIFALVMIPGWASGQVCVDSFSYPDGTTIPGWTEQVGNWIISNGKLQMAAGVPVCPTCPVFRGFITKNGWNLVHSVTEVTVSYVYPPSFLFGGACARWSSSSTNLVGAARDQGLNGVFNYLQIGENGGGNTMLLGISPSVSSCRLRLRVTNVATVFADLDFNGTWDLQHTMSLFNTVWGPADTKNGCVVMYDTNPSIRFDDFKLFDAVITPSGTPQVGGTLTLNLQGKTPGATYQAACSFSNSPGLPVDLRRIPLTLDSLMYASLGQPAIFSNFSGTLSSPAATATAFINIPNVPGLVGQVFYAGFVELVPSAPSGIGAISNDERIVVQ